GIRDRNVTGVQTCALPISDDEILYAFRLITRKEGIFAEPGSCASIAGVLQQVKAGNIASGTKVVAVLTGNGLKDPDTAIAQYDVDPVSLPNDKEVISSYIKEVAER